MGMGGIMTATDVVEFMLAGAAAVQVGTANFVDPFIWPKLLSGLTDYLDRHQYRSAKEIVGTVDLAHSDVAWISS